jgi:hypothetical protein
MVGARQEPVFEDHPRAASRTVESHSSKRAALMGARRFPVDLAGSFPLQKEGVNAVRRRRDIAVSCHMAEALTERAAPSGAAEGGDTRQQRR